MPNDHTVADMASLASADPSKCHHPHATFEKSPDGSMLRGECPDCWETAWIAVGDEVAA